MSRKLYKFSVMIEVGDDTVLIKSSSNIEELQKCLQCLVNYEQAVGKNF